MNRTSLFLKLFLGNFLLVGLAFLVAGVVSYRSISARYAGDVANHQDRLTAIAQQYIEHLWPQPGAEIDRICKQFAAAKAEGDAQAAGQDFPIRLTVIAQDGRVLGDSLSDPAAMENHKNDARPEVMAALAGGTGLDVRRSDTLFVEYRYLALPVRSDGRVVAAVRVATPAGVMIEIHAVIRNILISAAVAAIAAFALVGLVGNWLWQKPLHRLVAGARRIAGGDLDHRIEIGGARELGQLALALNEMRENLARQIRTVTAQREDLRQVVANLSEGVVAVGVDGKILLANVAAQELLAPGGADLVGQRFEAAVRHASIVDAWNRAVAGRKAVLAQLEIPVKGARRHIDLHAAPMPTPGAGGVAGLVVVRDVTDLVLAATMKAEFVANASHELRTPLATLRAAVDSLSSEAAGQEPAAGLAAILDRHVRRLENLTSDLLDLGAVEDARREVAAEPIPLGSLADWARTQFGDRAAEKGLALEVAAVAAGDVLVSDRGLVELILRNLLDNAVKFTPRGGCVTMRVARQGGGVCFEVLDTGVGIRPADQPRVFERFFQTDAARTGDSAARGIGLGLAIVKHACERLGATVSLESEFGSGTTVTVCVPNNCEKERV
ncbi:MAG: ATP-binding protein [Planctomycetota bacterium]|nr:ATP-binding protein [Planctomycetota bacterium]